MTGARPYRLVVRTPPSQGGNTGSTPVGVTIVIGFSPVPSGSFAATASAQNHGVLSLRGAGAGYSRSTSRSDTTGERQFFGAPGSELHWVGSSRNFESDSL